MWGVGALGAHTQHTVCMAAGRSSGGDAAAALAGDMLRQAARHCQQHWTLTSAALGVIHSPAATPGRDQEVAAAAAGVAAAQAQVAELAAEAAHARAASAEAGSRAEAAAAAQAAAELALSRERAARERHEDVSAPAVLGWACTCVHGAAGEGPSQHWMSGGVSEDMPLTAVTLRAPLMTLARTTPPAAPPLLRLWRG